MSPLSRLGAFVRRPFVAGALVAAAVLVPAAAIGQPKGPPDMPPGHPPIQQPPPQIGPDGRPVPGRRPMPRPGMPPPTAPKKPTPPAADAHKEEHGGGHGPGHCPGHGPTDPPGHVNWWKGLLWIDNEKSQQPGLNQLLYRYENKLDPCDPKNLPPPFLASLLNFGLFGFVLFRFGKKPLEDSLRKRKQQIMTDIDTATRLREQAEDRLAEYEDKLERLEETLEQLRKEQRAQAEAERKAILAEAEEKKARLVRDAEVRVEQELAAAKEEIVKEALLAALVAAEDLVQKRSTAADHERIGREYLGQLGPALEPRGEAR